MRIATIQTNEDRQAIVSGPEWFAAMEPFRSNFGRWPTVIFHSAMSPQYLMSRTICMVWRALWHVHGIDTSPTSLLRLQYMYVQYHAYLLQLLLSHVAPLIIDDQFTGGDGAHTV
jgi:hypothetical protein